MADRQAELFDWVPPVDPARALKEQRGSRAWHSGAAAEDMVERAYLRRGLRLVARRWRKGGGEIDLVMREGERLVFIEVKQARDFDRAADRISERQIARLHKGAEVFLAQQPMGELTACRFDAALVNERGEIHIIENAF